MNRDPCFAPSQKLEAKQTLLDQLRALAAEDPDFLTDLIEGETNFLKLIAVLDASIINDEILVDGAKAALDKLQARKRGLWRDNVFVERLWRSIKYEEVYLKAYETVAEAPTCLGTWSPNDDLSYLCLRAQGQRGRCCGNSAPVSC